jgi:hypothetical protein
VYLNYEDRIVVLSVYPLFLLAGHIVTCVSLLAVPVRETSNFLLLLGTLITETQDWRRSTKQVCHCARNGEGGESRRHIQTPTNFTENCIVTHPIKKFSQAASWLRRLIVGFPPRRPRLKPESGHAGFYDGQKWRWGRFSPRTSVSTCQSTFLLLLHNHLHYHRRLAQ